jgi:phenylpropionate dioxygenase-like ring-hydroxylating dioxygenase large terminal subunit
LTGVTADPTPVRATGRYSVVHLPGFWYVACLSRELKDKPLARTVAGVPLALFRAADGRPVAVLDRCPHRNMPLSLGTRRDGELECRYHGWRFDAAGSCRAVPGLPDTDTKVGRPVDTYAIAERDGFVWVTPSNTTSPPGEPYRLPHVGDPGYTTVHRSLTVAATLLAALENTLDVPHTAYLHRGLFRGGRDPVAIGVTVRHGDGIVEAIYEGEPRPPGLAAKLLAPEGGEVEHTDRFILPSIAQVEYRLGDNHLVITTAYTPISDFETGLHAAVTFKSRVPALAVRALVTPIANFILRQDAWVLRHQTENIRRFGGEQFASTRIDVLGPHIWRLLRRAERGEGDGAAPREERLTLHL